MLPSGNVDGPEGYEESDDEYESEVRVDSVLDTNEYMLTAACEQYGWAWAYVVDRCETVREPGTQAISEVTTLYVLVGQAWRADEEATSRGDKLFDIAVGIRDMYCPNYSFMTLTAEPVSSSMKGHGAYQLHCVCNWLRLFYSPLGEYGQSDGSVIVGRIFAAQGNRDDVFAHIINAVNEQGAALLTGTL